MRVQLAPHINLPLKNFGGLRSVRHVVTNSALALGLRNADDLIEFAGVDRLRPTGRPRYRDFVDRLRVTVPEIEQLAAL